MTHKYFAYGSNMSEQVMHNIGCNPILLGIGCVNDFRLAFTRKSQKNYPGSGVADIISEPGFKVWGVLWEIDQQSLNKLRDKEGIKAHAYEQINIKVMLNGKSYEAITFTVVNKESKEVCPYKSYIQIIVTVAKSFNQTELNFPKYYINFLEYLEYLASEKPDGFRKGFLVKSTNSRKEYQGINLIKLPIDLKDDHLNNSLCIVEYKNKLCPAKIVYEQNIDINTCHIDQSIREALGIKGTELYGHYVNILKSNIKLNRLPFINPTVLILPLSRASINDSEKKICVLHEKRFRLLGIEEGDYLTITTVVKNKIGVPIFKKISRRAFSGTAETILINGLVEQKYPTTKQFYLDLDGRLELGQSQNEARVPIIVYPDLLKLLLQNIRNYGTTLFLGLLALPPLTKELAEVFNLSSSAGFLIGIFLALFFTFILTLLDLKSRVQY